MITLCSACHLAAHGKLKRATSRQVKATRSRTRVALLHPAAGSSLIKALPAFAILISPGVYVVLESGFGSGDERPRFRARATELGAETKLIFLDVPREELLMRLALRNESQPPDGEFQVDLSQLDVWASMFQPATPDEPH